MGPSQPAKPSSEHDEKARSDAEDLVRLRKREAARLRRMARKATKRKLVSCPTCEHNPFTHFPFDPNCEICINCRTHKSYCRQKVEPNPDA